MGIVRPAQLTEATEAEVAALHGMGSEALWVLRAALDEAGRGFTP